MRLSANSGIHQPGERVDAHSATHRDTDALSAEVTVNPWAGLVALSIVVVLAGVLFSRRERAYRRLEGLIDSIYRSKTRARRATGGSGGRPASRSGPAGPRQRTEVKRRAGQRGQRGWPAASRRGRAHSKRRRR